MARMVVIMTKKAKDEILLNLYQAFQISLGFLALNMIPDFGNVRLIIFKVVLSGIFLVALVVWVFKTKFKVSQDGDSKEE